MVINAMKKNTVGESDREGQRGQWEEAILNVWSGQDSLIRGPVGYERGEPGAYLGRAISRQTKQQRQS